tara:strand:- start:7613 stop:8635 length:1023 start_codon:yes stop_codon:yes gene_type:complete
MKIAIIGGGLAGTACAYVLKNAGHEPVIFEASDSLASGASGNKIGLYNPRFTAQKDKVAEFYSSAFFKALEVFEKAKSEIDWNPCGALHLINDEKKQKRFPKTVESWEWSDQDMHLVSATEASKISGIEIPNDALYLPRSGFVSPAKLCTYYAKDVDTQFNQKIENLEDLECDAIILACGMGAKHFYPELPIKPVRGQVTYVQSEGNLQNLKCTIGYGGYVAPSLNGVHCIGSTFQRWLDHSDLLDEDNDSNIQKCVQNLPVLDREYKITDQKAGIRTTSKDHMPIIGQIDQINGKIPVFISTAHGSHGILSSLAAANILEGLINNKENQIDSVVTVKHF